MVSVEKTKEQAEVIANSAAGDIIEKKSSPVACDA